MSSYETQLRPLVSICIPVFNGENYIDTCIKSVLEQNYENFELLILDNCSTDSTASIIFDIKDDRIRYIKNKENIGALNNFSKCISQAYGEYFVLLPHDDLLMPGFISNYVEKLEDKSIGLVYSSVKIINAEGRFLYSRIIHKKNLKFNSEEAIEDLFKNFMPIQLAMVRTTILKNVGGFDGDYGIFTDAQLWLKVFLDGWGCFYLSNPYNCHRTHANQGQAAFLQLKLDILSDHWGRKLDKEFWKNNSYNVFCLRLMQFVKGQLSQKNINKSNINNLMIDIFITSHIRFIILSLIRINGFVFWQEILLFGSIIKSYGILVLFRYPLIFVKEIKKRIVKKIAI